MFPIELGFTQLLFPLYLECLFIITYLLHFSSWLPTNFTPTSKSFFQRIFFTYKCFSKKRKKKFSFFFAAAFCVEFLFLLKHRNVWASEDLRPPFQLNSIWIFVEYQPKSIPNMWGWWLINLLSLLCFHCQTDSLQYAFHSLVR